MKNKRNVGKTAKKRGGKGRGVGRSPGRAASGAGGSDRPSSKRAGRPGPRSPLRAPQQARSRATRRRVLEAAIACFERNGFEETTTAMIAERAGVAVGSVYNYFVDKRALILELLEETDRQLADQVVAQLDPASWRGRTDPRDLTRTLIDGVFRAQSLRPGIQRILWARYFKDPDFEEPFEAIRDRIRQAIVAFIDAVDEQGLLRPGLDRKMAPFVILNAVQWNATQAFFRGEARFVEQAARATAELVARYVFRDGERDGGREAGRVRRSRSR